METLDKGVKYVQYHQVRRSGVFIVNFEHISHLFLVYLLYYLCIHVDFLPLNF